MQMFPHHYHPNFVAGPTRSLHTSKAVPSASHADISREEEEERGRYGGFSSHLQKEKFVGSFPGNYAWICRLDTLGTAVEAFQPDEKEYLSLHATSNLPDSPLNDFSESACVHPVPQRNWYEATQSTATNSGTTVSSMFTTTFVTGIRKKISAGPAKNGNADVNDSIYPFKCHYDNHWFLPPAPHKKSKLLRVDFVSDFIVAYYSEGNSQDPSQIVAVGMAIYATNIRSYSYVR